MAASMTAPVFAAASALPTAESEVVSNAEAPAAQEEQSAEVAAETAATNLAQNKTVVLRAKDGTSVSNENHAVKLAVDGKHDNAGQHVQMDQNKAPNQPYYIQVDLEQLSNIQSVKLWRYWDDSRKYHKTVVVTAKKEADFADASKCTILFNADKGNVCGFGNGTAEEYSETADGKTFDVTTTTQARFVRVYMQGSNKNDDGHVVELEVMGTPAETKPEPDAGEQYVAINKTIMKDSADDNGHEKKAGENDGPASQAFDDTNKLWHSKYNKSTTDGNPFTIKWNVVANPVADAPVNVGKITYHGRSNNGNWEKVRVLVTSSEAGKDERAVWTEVYNGDVTSNSANRYTTDIVFSKVMPATAVKVEVLRGSNGFACAQELEVYKDTKAVVEQPEQTAALTGKEVSTKLDQKLTGDIRTNSENALTNDKKEGPAKLAFDGDENTRWHSNYASEATKEYPYYIGWGLDQPRWVSGIEYVKRAVPNGKWKNFRVWGKLDNQPGKQWPGNATGAWAGEVGEQHQGWTLLYDGSEANWADDTKREMIDFHEAYNVNYLAVEVLGPKMDKATGDFAAAPEIYTYTMVDPAAASRAELRAAYAAADTRKGTLKQADYEEASWATMAKTLTDAKKVLDNEDAKAEQLSAQLALVRDAFDGLKPVAGKIVPWGHEGGTTVDTPFPKPEATPKFVSEHVRIPGLITLNNGWLAASIDARWNHHGDHGNIDTLFSVSEDGGKTWTYNFPNYFNDTIDEQKDHAANLMDPVLVQDKGGRIYLLVDAFPGGHAIHGLAPYHPGTDGGFVDVNGTQRLAVYRKHHDQMNDQYDYYVGDFAADENALQGKQLAPVVAKGAEANTASYYVDQWYNLYDVNKEAMYCAQIGSDKYVQQNLFYENAALHVRSATFLWLVTSDDNGKTWSAPKILNNHPKNSNCKFNGVGPGAGLRFQSGKDEVIILPTYVNPNEHSGFVYSYDRGETWISAPNVPGGSSESAMVQISDTVARKFVRDGNSNVAYYDYTWHPETKTFTVGQLATVSGAHKTQNNQVSAIRYREDLYGKPTILLSTAAGDAGNREKGRVYVMTVESNGSMKVVGHKQISKGNPKYKDYHYSSLTEMPNGDVALLYEDQCNHYMGEGSRGTVKFMVIPKADLIPQEQGFDMFVGETKSYDGQVTVDDESIVSKQNEVASETGTKGLKGTNSTFNGDGMLLSKAMYTFTEKGEGKYVIQGTAEDGTPVYLAIRNGSGNGYPFNTVEKPVEVMPYGNNTFDFKDEGTNNGRKEPGFLYLWDKTKNSYRFDINSKTDPNCHFELYRLAENNQKASAEIPGFVRVNTMKEIQSGEKYLIVGQRDGMRFAVKPDNRKDNYYRQVLKVTDQTMTQQTVTGTTLTAKKPGVTYVTVGNTVQKVTVADAKLAGASLSLAGNIGVNFYYRFAESLKDVENLVVDITINDDTKDAITQYQLKLKDGVKITKENCGAGNEAMIGCYKLTAPVTARQMTNTITATVKNGTKVVRKDTYSVRQYAKTILDGEYPEQTKEMVEDMLYYGAQMQQYKEYKTTDLATSVLKEDQLAALDAKAEAVTAETLASYQESVTGRINGLTLNTASLQLRSGTGVDFYFTLAENENLAAYTFTCNGKVLTPTFDADSHKGYLEVSDISADKLGEKFTLNITKGNETCNIQYSPMCYARKVLSAQTDAQLVKVVQAMYLYNQAACTIKNTGI